MSDSQKEELNQVEEEDVERELRNKIKILKNAFLKEREDHVKLKRKYEALEDQKKQLEILVVDKENAYTDLIQQSQQLQEVILHEQMRNEELTKLKSNVSFKSIFGKKDNKCSSEFLQVQADNQTLKRQNLSYLDKIKNLQNEVEKLKNELTAVQKEKEQNRDQFDKDLEERNKTIQLLNKDLKHALKSNSELIDQKSKLEDQVSELNKKEKSLQNDLDLLNQQFNDKQELILLLNSSLQKQSINSANLATKLMNMKNELAQAQSNLQVFNVLKYGSLMNSSAQIRLLKDSEEFILEINNLGKIRSYLASDINAVQLLPEENHLFILLLNVSNPIQSERDPFMFESSDAPIIVKKIREFLQEALDDQKINGAPFKEKQKQVVQNLSQFL